jgi:hypothetical protein
MNRSRTKGKGVTQTSNRNAVSKSLVPLKPESANIEKPGRSTLVSNDSSSSADPHIPKIGHEQIAERAKAIWVQRGRPQGQDQVNWSEAEAQLRAEL